MQNASSRVNIGLDYFDMKVKCKQIINVNVNHASRSHCKQFLCNTKQTQSQYCYTANKMKKVNMRCSCIHWLFNIPGCRGHREAQLSSRNRWMDCEYFQSHLIPFQVPQLGQFSSQTTPIPQTPILVPPSSFIAHPPHKHTHPSFPCHCPLVGQLLWLKAIPNKNSAHAASGGRICGSLYGSEWENVFFVFYVFYVFFLIINLNFSYMCVLCVLCVFS